METSSGEHHDVREFVDKAAQVHIFRHQGDELRISEYEFLTMPREHLIKQLDSWVEFSCENGEKCYSRTMQLEGNAKGSARKFRDLQGSSLLKEVIDPKTKTWAVEQMTASEAMIQVMINNWDLLDEEARKGLITQVIMSGTANQVRQIIDKGVSIE